MDGAAATLAAVTSAAVGALALIEGDVLSPSWRSDLPGRALGFLPYNLASPARIFLGDGGSLPIGFVVAREHHGAADRRPSLASSTSSPRCCSRASRARHRSRDASHGAAPASRFSRAAATTSPTGSPPGLGAHVPWRSTLGAAQAAARRGRNRGSAVRATARWLWHGRSGSWWPTGADRAARDAAPGRPSANRLRLDTSTSSHSRTGRQLAAPGAPCLVEVGGDRLYRSLVWPQPLPLRLLRRGGLGADRAGHARRAPRPPDRAARGSTPGCTARGGRFGGVSGCGHSLSTGWAESADQAMTEANRWLLYAALFGVLVLLLKSDRLGAVVVGAGRGGDRSIRDLPAGTDARGLRRGALPRRAVSTSRLGTSTARPAIC